MSSHSHPARPTSPPLALSAWITIFFRLNEQGTGAVSNGTDVLVGCHEHYGGAVDHLSVAFHFSAGSPTSSRLMGDQVHVIPSAARRAGRNVSTGAGRVGPTAAAAAGWRALPAPGRARPLRLSAATSRHGSGLARAAPYAVPATAASGWGRR